MSTGTGLSRRERPGDSSRVTVRKLVSHLVRQPTDTFMQVGAYVRARSYLRDVDHLGSVPQVYGRCEVRKRKGYISIADRFVLEGEPIPCLLAVHDGGRLEIGSGIYVNYGSRISAHELVTIGDFCLIGQEVLIMDCDFHDSDPIARRGGSHGAPAPVRIGDGVWLCARVIVLKGVTVGANTIVAAGSVVVSSLPAGVIAGGNPARVLRALP